MNRSARRLALMDLHGWKVRLFEFALFILFLNALIRLVVNEVFYP
jgi:hypothetical protein